MNILLKISLTVMSLWMVMVANAEQTDANTPVTPYAQCIQDRMQSLDKRIKQDQAQIENLSGAQRQEKELLLQDYIERSKALISQFCQRYK